MLNKRGFTILELTVVVAIITILAALLIPAGSSARERARSAKAKSHIAALEVALTAFHNDFGFYPTSQISGTSPNFTVSSGAQTETSNATIIEILTGFSFSGGARSVSSNALCQSTTWHGPYLDLDTADVNTSGELKDPWNTAYTFSLALDSNTNTPPTNNAYSYDIESTGSGKTISNY